MTKKKKIENQEMHQTEFAIEIAERHITSLKRHLKEVLKRLHYVEEFLAVAKHPSKDNVLSRITNPPNSINL